jgi:hypothetical protein
MLKQKTFSQFNIEVNIDSLKKNLLNLNFYNKSFLITNSLLNTDEVILINNYNRDNSIVKNSFLKKNHKMKNILGSSINSKYESFVTKTSDPMHFRLNSLAFNYKTPFLNALYDSFLLFDDQNKKKYYFVLKPKKGGYKAFYNGFFAFVPRRQLLLGLFKKVKRFANYEDKDVLNNIKSSVLRFLLLKNRANKKFYRKRIVLFKTLIRKDFFNDHSFIIKKILAWSSLTSLTLKSLPTRFLFARHELILTSNFLTKKKFVFLKYKKRRGKDNSFNLVLLTNNSEKKKNLKRLCVG